MVESEGLDKLVVLIIFGVGVNILGAKYVVPYVVDYIIIPRFYERRYVRSLQRELELGSEISHYSHLSKNGRKGLEILSDGNKVMNHYEVLGEMSPLIRNRIREVVNTYPIKDSDDY